LQPLPGPPHHLPIIKCHSCSIIDQQCLHRCPKIREKEDNKVEDIVDDISPPPLPTIPSEQQPQGRPEEDHSMAKLLIDDNFSYIFIFLSCINFTYLSLYKYCLNDTLFIYNCINPKCYFADIISIFLKQKNIFNFNDV